MAAIDIAEGNRLAEEHGLWAARGRAIQGYAGLEGALCQVFALCAGVPDDVAVMIFSKLNANPQRKMLDELLTRKFARQYAPFWMSVFNKMEKLTNTRNNIVHWSALAVYGADEAGKTTADIHLKPATVSPLEFDNEQVLTAEDMRAFEAQCDFWAKAVSVFCRAVRAESEGDTSIDGAKWLAVFRQSLAYPPAPTHPLAPLSSS